MKLFDGRLSPVAPFAHRGGFRQHRGLSGFTAWRAINGGLRMNDLSMAPISAAASNRQDAEPLIAETLARFTAQLGFEPDPGSSLDLSCSDN